MAKYNKVHIWSYLKKIAFLGILGGGVCSCIDPYAGDIQFSGSKLVIEGQIHDQPGPYQVRISESVAYNSTDGSVPVQNAKVMVRDDRGNTFAFAHIDRGVYASDPLKFRGEAGRSYQLLVETADGKQIQSVSERLVPAPPIDTAFTVPVVSRDYRGIETTAFAVLVRFRDSTTPGDYYRLNYARYETENFCNVRIVGELAVAFKNRCCGPCWKVTPCRGCILLQADNLVNGNSIDYKLATIPYDSQDYYFIGIELSRISQANYQFWRAASTQINNTGGIFDAPPSTLPGNLYNPADPKEQVLGIFSVAGLAQKGVYLKRNYLNFNPPNVNIGFPTQELPECTECIESYSRTRKKPLGW